MNSNDDPGSRTLSHLASENSPYLLQHADNPVNWFPWGEEAFAKARNEDKPIFLSIGYSTCHWCHVMEHESFEDEGVAGLMNEAFVNIKVDREERPDIDNIYMSVCQIMNGSGGWPLTIIMTPDKKPFFSGTYFPKHSRYGRIGMMELIPQISNAWKNRKQDIEDTADRITTALSSMNGLEVKLNAGSLSASTIDEAYDYFQKTFDETSGGFGNAPKFPTPHNLLFLLRIWKRDKNERALHMVEETLTQMRMGGIFDHLGYGFHRYSTDPQWLLPHFEKMLYDQALLTIAYLETYQATGKDTYRETAEEILTYVLRDMTSPDGGFFSAEDADSEGEEGKFYLWTIHEIKEILGPTEAELFASAYRINENGNFTDESTGGKNNNILHLTKSLEQIADEQEIHISDLRIRLQNARTALFTVRGDRIHPQKDDKILTDWNGLMIAALSLAGRILDDPDYTSAAQRAADFVLKEMTLPSGGLLHRYRKGEAGISGNIDDYAFLTWGLIELYETTFRVGYLERALSLTEYQITHFWDDDKGGFYFTPNDAERLLMRTREIYDGAVPSGNSVSLLNLLKLSHITANPELEEKADQMLQAFSAQIKSAPAHFTHMLNGLIFAQGPTYEVIIAGDREDHSTTAMIQAINNQYQPNLVVIQRPCNKEAGAITQIAPFVKLYEAINGQTAAYVCKNNQCSLPTSTIEEMLKHLK
ncbi:thioredoxin domain-containing protein [candidate division LCP-89 bacterium B3_LCP]|uniref:Thioredoxin domain-containing protein n=1 Tax=candidate division LCP-89 bacterium B3_LCP TaxID=2012998 RepID=A0A532V5X5_UNCL8|nr:MAG: thioredoxin domain-containing protein [candidate division LCP-89 bacterium B3_LCP]